jgi:hypothetical protein
MNNIDACPGCQQRDEWALDLSHQAMSDLVGGWDEAVNLGLINVSWNVAPCGNHGTFNKGEE